jgi:hypothetical protein
MWSKIKAALRKAKACTVDALFEALKDALNAVSISDIRAWFVNAGYSVQY